MLIPFPIAFASAFATDLIFWQIGGPGWVT